MSVTYRRHNTPDAIKGKYVVCRQWNTGFGGGFLMAWDDQHGATFSSIVNAMAFDSYADAIRATIRAKQVVPRSMPDHRGNTFSFWYDVGVAA